MCTITVRDKISTEPAKLGVGRLATCKVPGYATQTHFKHALLVGFTAYVSCRHYCSYVPPDGIHLVPWDFVVHHPIYGYNIFGH